MRVTINVISRGQGRWGDRLFEYVEYDQSLASKRDVADGTSRISHRLAFREPNSAGWHGRRFKSPEERSSFVEEWIIDREVATDLALPDDLGEYLPRSLSGQRVSSIVFVENYIQLIADNTQLDLFIDPEFHSSKTKLVRADPGFFDALAGLIDDTINTFEEQYGEHLEVLFKSGARLVIPWDTKYGEIAKLQIGDQWCIWPDGD